MIEPRRRTALMLVLVVMWACAKAPPNLSPQGQVAFKADQIVLRVGELQNAATQANAGGALDEATTRTIVTWTVSAAQILKTTPAGWQAALVSSWTAVKGNLPLRSITNPTVQLAFTAVDAIIGGLAP